MKGVKFRIVTLCKGFIKDWALGKLTCCEDDFAVLEESFSYNEVPYEGMIDYRSYTHNISTSDIKA